MLNFIKNIGFVEIAIIAGILLLFFGGKKVREFSRGMGESAKEIKHLKDEIKPGKKKNTEEEKDEDGQDS